MDAEKQEGQKTVVAFITGLLIGGLLVWVFSSTPETVVTTDEEATATEVADDTEDDDAAVSVVRGDEVSVSDNGTGLLDVANQAAGSSVTLDEVTYPSRDGWIVVRDYANGVQGKILGAARYSTTEELNPTTISLLRNTVKGSTYQVMFYTENGDKKFSTPGDTGVSEGAVTFEAN